MSEKFSLKSIKVGKHSGRPLDPTDIEFQFYIDGDIIDSDGEITDKTGISLVTHTYDECEKHTVKIQQVTDPKHIEYANIHLLISELLAVLRDVIYKTHEQEYQESLINILNDFIHEGHHILSLGN